MRLEGDPVDAVRDAIVSVEERAPRRDRVSDAARLRCLDARRERLEPLTSDGRAVEERRGSKRAGASDYCESSRAGPLRGVREVCELIAIDRGKGSAVAAPPGGAVSAAGCCCAD